MTDLQLNPVVIEGSQRESWRYAFVLAGFGLVSSPVAALLAASEGPSKALRPLAAFGLVLGFFVALGALHMTWSYLMPGRTRYVCDGETLRVERGNRTLKSIECKHIKSMWFPAVMTWKRITLTNGFPPRTPWLVISLTTERGFGFGTAFPSILVWGRPAIAEASVSLAIAAGVEPNRAWEMPELNDLQD